MKNAEKAETSKKACTEGQGKLNANPKPPEKQRESDKKNEQPTAYDREMERLEKHTERLSQSNIATTSGNEKIGTDTGQKQLQTKQR